jgi:hypothetical protein
MSVVVCVMFAGLFGVVCGVVQMAFGDMRVVARFFVITGRVMLSGGLVMFSGVFMVLCRFMMVLDCVFGHAKLSWRKVVLLLVFRRTPSPAYSRFVTAPCPRCEFQVVRRASNPDHLLNRARQPDDGPAKSPRGG